MRAEKEWKNCIDTKIACKFEEMRSRHHKEMQDLMVEIRKEKIFRDEQARKVFEQWHENISLQCVITTSVKLPYAMLGDVKRTFGQEKIQNEEDEEKLIDLNITRRLRDPEAFIESQSAFESQFRLMNEFTDKYEYKMKGTVEVI